MRKLIVCNIVSLDGYYEGPDGDVMARPVEREISRLDTSIDKVVVSGQPDLLTRPRRGTTPAGVAAAHRHPHLDGSSLVLARYAVRPGIERFGRRGP